MQRYLPPSSNWTTEVVDAVPFMFIALFLIYNLIRRDLDRDSDRVGGALDRAITPQGAAKPGISHHHLVLTTRTTLSTAGGWNTPTWLLALLALLAALGLGGVVWSERARRRQGEAP